MAMTDCEAATEPTPSTCISNRELTKWKRTQQMKAQAGRNKKAKKATDHTVPGNRYMMIAGRQALPSESSRKRATPDKDPLDLSDDRTDSGIFEKDSDSEDLDLENSQPDHDEDDLEDEGFGRMDGQDNRTDKAKNKKKRSSRESSRQGHKGDSQPGLVRLSGGLSWDSGDKEKEGEPLRLPHLPNLGQDNQLLGTPLGHRTGGVKAVPEVDAFIRGMTKFPSPVVWFRCKVPKVCPSASIAARTAPLLFKVRGSRTSLTFAALTRKKPRLVESRVPKIYDCFIFGRDSDLVEIRLQELHPVVDHFIIVESLMTFRGNPKRANIATPLASLPADITRKVHYVLLGELKSSGVLNPFPKRKDGTQPFSTPDWIREMYHREALFSRGLATLDPRDLPEAGDILVVSDTDEILKPRTAFAMKHCVEFSYPLAAGSPLMYYFNGTCYPLCYIGPWVQGQCCTSLLSN
eukprot:gene1923-33334_t